MGKLRFFLIALLFVGSSTYSQQKLLLYSDNIPGSKMKLNEEDQPTLEVYLPEKSTATGTAVIIFPGGAYSFIAYAEEGIAIARAFAKKGIISFVVKYRLPKRQTMQDKSLGPLADAQQAMKVVRSKAREWNIDSKKIGVVGYSAGGHLASTLGTHFKESYISNVENISLRPDFMVLVYPLISMRDSLTHMGSRIALLGIEPSKKKVEFFSNELQVNQETPPSYLTHTGDDSIVDVKNSIIFYEALQKHCVDAELHLFPKGNHGFTQRLSLDEWINPILNFLRREGYYNQN